MKIPPRLSHLLTGSAIALVGIYLPVERTQAQEQTDVELICTPVKEE